MLKSEKAEGLAGENRILGFSWLLPVIFLGCARFGLVFGIGFAAPWASKKTSKNLFLFSKYESLNFNLQ